MTKSCLYITHLNKGIEQGRNRLIADFTHSKIVKLLRSFKSGLELQDRCSRFAFIFPFWKCWRANIGTHVPKEVLTASCAVITNAYHSDWSSKLRLYPVQAGDSIRICRRHLLYSKQKLFKYSRGAFPSLAFLPLYVEQSRSEWMIPPCSHLLSGFKHFRASVYTMCDLYTIWLSI